MINFKQYTEICESAEKGLAAKAEKSGVSLSILRKVYRRGVAAWNSGHRPGTTPQQWGMARVNSYITKGKGTYHGADKDLREDLDEAESWEAGYQRRVVKTTSADHKEKGYNWRIKGKERPEISIKLYKEKPSQAEFNKQMRRVAGHEFGEETVVEDSRIDNAAYHKGVSDSTAKARVAHWKKMDKLSDRDPRAYEPAPGDATAKTKESKHTKKYRDMFGEEVDEELFEACWDGYKQVGIKKKGDKMVPNCVKEEEDLEEATYKGKKVPLNKPMAGDVKKSKVYVDPDGDGKAKKVEFGDPNMTIKKNIPARRKSFRARHGCDDPNVPKPKDKARYWSCKAW